VDTLSGERGWWDAEYLTEGKNPKPYYPDEFRWHECPVATLTRERDDGFDPIALVQIVTEARSVGGRGGVFAVARRDPRLYTWPLLWSSARGLKRLLR
jgi:hypothetical protein